MSSSELSCIFCKKSFEDKEQLKIHFRKHGDPKFNQNARNNKSGSANEPQTETEKSNEEDVVGCDVCSEVFPTISKAITHKHKMHPDHDAKYFCPWCGKLFTMKHLYIKHIESSHNSSDDNAGSGFHCDYCDVNFFAAAAMVYHNKFFHRQDTELAAIGYCKKLKHFEQEIFPIYYCPFCGEEYLNKVNLHKHMGDDHIDENQSPDDVLRCPLCEAIFYHLDAYELHLTFHSSDDVYSDENDIVKNITEFSLEAVPPLMEKVENESQEDDPDNSIGIENFLQQAMNESNDNDVSNEDVPHKKKKHKKHKKSKKSTITLDEFLSMNTDVFGEGLDVQVQGIVEVPSQVVAKQLRKPQNMKKRPTAMQSKEIEKLRKQGIVIKKKSGNAKPYQGVSDTTKGNPQQQFKLPAIPPSKATPISTTSEVLNKLLNQGNSQIKIVKKSSQNIANSETDIENESPDPIEPDDEAEIDTEEQETNETEKTNEQNLKNYLIDSPGREEIHATEVDLTKPIPLKWKDDPPYENYNHNTNGNVKLKENDFNVGKKTNSEAAIDVLKTISQHITIKSLANSKKNTFENVNIDNSGCESNEGRYEEKNSVTETRSDKESLNALKNLSHLTVKSVKQEISKSLPENCNVTSQDEKPKVSNPEIVKQIPKALEALKNISKDMIVKSPSKSLQVTKSTIATIYGFDSDRSESKKSEKDIDKEKKLSTTVGLPDTRDVLKNLSEHLTVRAPNKSLQNTTKIDSEEDFNQDELHSDANDSDHSEERFDRDNQIRKTSDTQRLKPDLSPINALRNISKHITIKSPKISSEACDNADENIASEKEDFNQDEIYSDDNEGDEIHKNDEKSTSSPNLDALKKISKHITIKAPNNTTQVITKKQSEKGIQNGENAKKPHDGEYTDSKLQMNIKNEPKEEPKSLEALKNISKYITVKSLHKSLNDTSYTEQNEQENVRSQENQNIKNISKSPVSMKTNQYFKSPEIKKMSPMNSPVSHTPKDKQTAETGRVVGGQNVKKLPSDIMKQFPNLTAKSLNVTKSQKQQVTSSSQTKQISKGSFVQKMMKMEQSSEVIETFSIDDSEDEEANQSTYKKEPKAIMPSSKNKSSAALNMMKKLNTNITIKPSSKQAFEEIDTLPSPENQEAHDEEFGDFDDIPSPEQVHQKNTALQETLKTLGKNLSIKSTNLSKALPKSPNLNERGKGSAACSPRTSSSKSSPKPTQHQNAALANTLKNISKHISVKSTKTNNVMNSKDFQEPAIHDSDSDADANVKITEVENESSDDETISSIQNKIKDSAPKVIVEHPDESNSENDEEDPSNIEDQIKPNIIQKKSPESCADNKLVKYVNQNPSLKSLQDLNFDEDDECETEVNPDVGNLSKEISVKSFRPTICGNNKIANSRQIGQKLATSGQINAINREISVQSVQTFKTQTVIEEITTTVTKTIRTVNQSVNQELHSTNQKFLKPQICQRVQGQPSRTPQSNNLRGVQMRPMRPNIGVRVGNPMPQTRPATIPIRHPNQPRSNVPRQNNPRMPNAMRGQNMAQNEYKKIKIAPNAVATKRSQESSGHFSCFKKPKESLIPVPDVPTMSSHHSSGSPIQLKSAQMSKCNFSSTTQMVKGNSVVTSVQKKSQSSASTECKLNSMSGLKVVKTSQKQFVQEEKSEVSAPKRNALEAIERLQRQGLLIKKPRVEEHDEFDEPNDEPFSDDDGFDDET